MADDYTKSGFGDFLKKGSEKITPKTEELTGDDASYRTRQLSGTTISSGISRSSSGKTIVDWNKDEISISDGARKRVQMGNLNQTGVYGLRVTDSIGNIRFESSGDRNFSDIEGKKVTVGTEGDDYTDIQEAIDYIYSLGGGTVFVKKGTYTITENMTIYSNIRLLGEDFNDTTVVMPNPSSTTYYKLDTPTPDRTIYSTGTITVTTNSTTVTGSGTSWIGNLATGDFLNLKGTLFEIASVDSNTQLTLSDTYWGTTVSSLGYQAGPYYTNITIENIGFNGVSVTLTQVNNAVFRNILVKNSLNFFAGINFTRCANGLITGCISRNNRSTGIYLNTCHACVVENCRSSNNYLASGIYTIGTSSDGIVINNSSFISNGGYGIRCEAPAQLTNNLCDYNRSDGIYAFAGGSIILGNVCTANSDYGIDVFGLSNVILANRTNYNANGGLHIFEAGASPNIYTANLFFDSSTPIDNDATSIYFNMTNNIYSSEIHDIEVKRMKNNSGSTINVGEIVVFDNVAAGDNVTTTTTAGDNLVYGMMLANYANGIYGQVQTRGFTTKLKVDGTTDIAIGDFISTFTTAGIGQKATSGHTAIAIALEAYTTDDSNGVIDALIIPPRYVA